MKTILQISKFYFPEVGGIEKIAQAVSNALDDDFKISILCYTRKKKDSVDIVDGNEVVRCGSKITVASQPLSISIVKKLKKYINELRPDYIIIHEPNPYMTFWLLKYIPKKVKLIVYWHSDIIKQRIGSKIFHKMYMDEMKRANIVIATSPNYIEGSPYLTYARDKCHVIPNCINEKMLNISERSHLIAEKVRADNKGKVICVGIGRVVSYKGFEYLADVARLVGERFVFYISGRPGESTPIIQKKIEGLNNFYLLGETTDDEQKGYLEACDIFCFPSIMKSEAFGIALAEGMYFEKPAVTFTIDGSGVNYVNLNGVTGIEVENCNVHDYANALVELADNESLRKKYGVAAKKRVEALFLEKDFSEKLKALF